MPIATVECSGKVITKEAAASHAAGVFHICGANISLVQTERISLKKTKSCDLVFFM